MGKLIVDHNYSGVYRVVNLEIKGKDSICKFLFIWHIFNHSPTSQNRKGPQFVLPIAVVSMLAYMI